MKYFLALLLTVPAAAEDLYPIHLSESRFEMLSLGVGHNRQRLNFITLQLFDPAWGLGAGFQVFRSERVNLTQPNMYRQGTNSEKLYQFSTFEVLWGPFYASYGRAILKFQDEAAEAPLVSRRSTSVYEVGLRWAIRDHVWISLGQTTYRMPAFANHARNLVWPARTQKMWLLMLQTDMTFSVRGPTPSQRQPL